jgi:hypothetical protein
MRGQEGGVMRGNATTSLHKTMRGQRSERTMRDVGSGDNNCSDNSNGDSDGDADSSNGDSGDDNSNRDSGGGNSDSGGITNNQLKPAVEKAAMVVDAALASILLAS